MGPTIGLPRSLLYHRYRVLWKAFFDGIGVETVESPPSNRVILDRGIRLAVDETCLPLKLLIGHVDALERQRGLRSHAAGSCRSRGARRRA